MIGHPQGACGAAGLAATVLAAQAGFVHPTINLDHPDPACDLDYVPGMRGIWKSVWHYAIASRLAVRTAQLIVRMGEKHRDRR